MKVPKKEIGMNIIDYIKKNRDKTFREYPFNEIDNLIFSLLTYIDFTNIVPAFKNGKITLKEAAEKLHKEKKNYRGMFIGNTFKMIEIMKDSKRYKDTLLYNYMKVVNDDMQFGAMTMKLPDKSIYISFAGTDTSIIGWEEDFKMTYLYPGASQKYASIYLNKTIGLLDKTIRIGGHSKGGNLAICAAMNAHFWIRRKVVKITNFDGPGFLKSEIESKAYKKIEPKIKMVVPKESIIGMLLYHTPDYIVVKSKGLSILQHDAFNWQCKDTKLIRDTQSKRSKALQQKLTKKLEELSLKERINLVQNLFNIFKNNNIKDTKEIKIREIFKLIKEFKKLDKETQNLLTELLIIIFIK